MISSRITLDTRNFLPPADLRMALFCLSSVTQTTGIARMVEPLSNNRSSLHSVMTGSVHGRCSSLQPLPFCYTWNCREERNTPHPPAIEKGKPPEKVGRKAKGPKQGQQMFQGQPSRHNAALLKRHWRAWFHPDASLPYRPQARNFGMEPGGVL